MHGWLRRTGEGMLNMLKPREHLEEWVHAQAIDGYHQN